MKLARRILAIVLASLGIAIVLALALAAFVLFTTPGGRLALRAVNARDLPVKVSSFDGALAGRFRLRDVTFTHGAIEAHVDTLTVAWRPGALRARRIALSDADVAGARVVVHEAPPDTAAPAASQAADTTATPWTVHAERIRVRRASVVAPDGVDLRDVRIDGSGGPDGYRADVRALGSAWRFRDADLFLRASGNTEGVVADSLTARILHGNVRGAGFVRWSPAVSWNVRIDGDSLRAGEIAAAPEEWLGAVALRVRSSGELHGDSARVDVDLAWLEGVLRERPLSARGRMALRGTRIQANDVRVVWGSARVVLSGSMAERADVTLRADIPSLGEILPDARGSARVEGRVSGTPSRVDIDITASGSNVVAGGRDIPDLRAVIDATLDAGDYAPYAAAVRRADVTLAGGKLSVTGRASWKDGVTWDATLHADDFETGTLAPARWDVSGPLTVHATTSGRRTRRELRGRCDLRALSGTFRGRAVSGSGSVAIRGRDADLSNFDVRWGDAHLAADGHYGDPLNLSVDLTAPDLSIVRDDFRGAVAIKGTASGPRRRPAVNATFRADSLRVRQYAVEHAEGDVDVDPDFNRPANARVLALGLSAGGAPFDTVRAGLDGHRHDHTASLEVRRADLFAAIDARGALADTVWTGHIERVRIVYPLAGGWRTETAAPVRATPSSVAVDSLVLVSNGARLFARGAWSQGDTTRVAVELNEFPMAAFQSRFPAGTRITGTLDGGADARIDANGVVTARAGFQTGPGRITLGGKWVDYHGNIAARADGAGVTGALDVSLMHDREEIALVDGDVRIPGYVIGRDSLGTQPIDGTLDLDCRDITPLLAVMAPDLASNTEGTLTARLSTQGNAGDFRLAGNVELANARFDLRSGLKLREVGLRLDADGSGRVAVEGGATSGGGRVTVSAASSRGGDARLSGNFRVRGERFQVMNQPEAQVFVTPDIDVRLQDRELNITGDVRVPYTRIELAEVPSTAVAQSRDVVFVEDTLATRAPVNVRTTVRVALGDSVTFAGFGLRSRLEGALVVNDEAGKPTRASGEIQLKDGRYRAYGNDLTIDPGRLIFSGPIDNPGLDIRAYRGLTTQNVMAGSSEMVGVRLTGTLRKPEFTTFSNPPMSQSETLSYLMFGRPLSAGSSSDQAALANAAAILGMSQGNTLAGNIGKQFALDEAYIETGETLKEASFVAGKYLSPKLFVSYAAGFYDRTNTFRVRYSLSNSWLLQAENGRYASSDILYRFEEGK